jgi:hypothetical protein
MISRTTFCSATGCYDAACAYMANAVNFAQTIRLRLDPAHPRFQRARRLYRGVGARYRTGANRALAILVRALQFRRTVADDMMATGASAGNLRDDRKAQAGSDLTRRCRGLPPHRDGGSCAMALYFGAHIHGYSGDPQSPRIMQPGPWGSARSIRLRGWPIEALGSCARQGSHDDAASVSPNRYTRIRDPVVLAAAEVST